MNKCAKFHKDSSSGKKVKLNLARAIELSETAVFCVHLCIETLCKRATLVSHLTNFSFEFVYEIFTEDASPLLLYHGAKKSKMTKTQIKGGPALSCFKVFWDIVGFEPSGTKSHRRPESNALAAIAFLYLFLFHSLSSSYFPSFSKWKSLF